MPSDVMANVPETVSVSFPTRENGVRLNSRFAIDITLSSLALAPYAGATGRAGKHLISSSQMYEIGAGNNYLEVFRLAKLLATDFYLWRLAFLELRLASYIAVEPEGLHDLEFWHDDPKTVVHRTGWEPDIGELFHAGEYGSSDCVCIKPGTWCGDMLVWSTELGEYRTLSAGGIPTGFVVTKVSSDDGCVAWMPSCCENWVWGSTDSWLIGPYFEMMTTDSYIVGPSVSFTTTDSYLMVPFDAFTTTDSWLIGPGFEETTTDSFLVLPFSEFTTTDSWLMVPTDAEMMTDSWLIGPHFEQTTTDSWLGPSFSAFTTTDSWLMVPFNIEVTTDSYVVGPHVSYTTTDSWLAPSFSEFTTTDSYLMVPWKYETTTDSYVVGPHVSYTTTDSYLIGPGYEKTTTDSWLMFEWAEKTTTDSYVVGPWYEKTTTDSFLMVSLYEKVTTDSFLMVSLYEKTTTDSYVVGPWYEKTTTDSFLMGPYVVGCTTDCYLGVDSEPPISTPCCENDIPAVLNMNISGKGDFPLTWNGSTGWSSGVVAVEGCGTISVTLTCSGTEAGDFILGNEADSHDCDLGVNALSVAVTCDPFEYSADATFGGLECSCSDTVTVTITI